MSQGKKRAVRQQVLTLLFPIHEVVKYLDRYLTSNENSNFLVNLHEHPITVYLSGTLPEMGDAEKATQEKTDISSGRHT